ncbi:MAG: ankyrin repeat domain-containing protein, partial [Gemmatimonadaceae bacterium]
MPPRDRKQIAGDEAMRMSQAERIALFLENACPDHHVRGGPALVMARHTAMRILRRHPEVARDSICTAIVCGDLEEAERVLRARPQAASEKSSAPGRDRAGAGHAGDLFRDIGPKGWEPLLYLCFTRLPLAAANDNAVALARMLLDHGADPNAYFMAGDSCYTPLVGVIGEGEEDRPPHPQRDALTCLLLERGAEPYDMQVVYNIAFHGVVLWFLELIYGQAVKLGRQADWDDPNWQMLDMGDYGNGARWHLNIAVRKNDVALAEWLLAHGASPNAAPPRDQGLSQRTLYEEALRNGFTAVAALLARYGATPSVVVLEGIEAFAAACLQLDRHKVKALIVQHPEYLRSPEAMFAAAKRDRADVVALLLDLGMSPDVEDGQRQRPLHIAAYAGSLGVAQLPIERGA